MANIIGGTNDGWCSAGVGSWNSMRSHAGSNFDSNNTYDIVAVGITYFARRGTVLIKRAFFEFDTSGVSVVPSDATLKIQGVTNGGGDVIAVRSVQGGTLAAGDFNSFLPAPVVALGNSDGSGAGTFAGISNLTYSAEISTWDTSGSYNDIALNATALADMVSLTTFKVCLMNYDHDYLDIAPSGTHNNGLRWAENGDTKWPYIDYTPGVADNATFFGTNF